MLKHFFISLLGALAAFWISIMLLFVVFFVGLIGAFAFATPSAPTVDNNSVMLIDLSGEIIEKDVASEPDINTLLYGKTQTIALNDLVGAIEAASKDKKIKGIYMRCPGSVGAPASRMTIREALLNFKKTGKWIVSYSDAYAQGDYYIATAATTRLLNPAGMVDIHGMGGVVMFYKGLLDKLGIEMQILKVGTFKSAVEPYINTEISAPARLQMEEYMKGIWGCLTEQMSQQLERYDQASLDSLASDMVMTFPAKKIQELGLVDELKYEFEAEDLIREKLGVEKDEDFNSIDFRDYLQSAQLPHSKSNDTKIAVYYAAGEIFDGGKTGIVSEKMVPELLAIADNEDIDALVLRVNSPGGSAFASEQIWKAVQEVKAAGKPVYVSMGDYAASGGYYISCGADKIFAQPVTITGSIGIFGMIPCVKGLATNILGLSFSTVQTNPNATFPSFYEPMTPFQHAKMQGMIENGYELFTSRCAEGRHLPIDSIKAIAEGRVWDGITAKRIGLVDELGGLEDALNALASELGAKNYQVVDYPDYKPNIWDFIGTLPVDIQQEAVKRELGAAYPIYQEARAICSRNPVQARLPFKVEF